MPEQFRLRLFVAGATTRSSLAIRQVRELCAAGLAGSSQLTVIDIYQQPELARTHRVVTTPTLIIDLPRSVRRFIGNLANIAGLFVDLQVSPREKVAL
ncbi:MAG TPA: circadian clock KaiB family protein [Lacunisphaera sp.]|nr:circadian clock KaiB family protein [Lacunisphaera sp.]